MRHYNIYAIKDHVAETFVGEEAKLFDLFFEAKITTSYSRLQILRKQIDYITKPFGILMLEREMKKVLKECSDYEPSEEYHLLNITNPRSQATLTLTESCLLIKSSGTFEAETTFFEVLRGLERCLLAMDFDREQYGWLNPIKQTPLNLKKLFG